MANQQKNLPNLRGWVKRQTDELRGNISAVFGIYSAILQISADWASLFPDSTSQSLENAFLNGILCIQFFGGIFYFLGLKKLIKPRHFSMVQAISINISLRLVIVGSVSCRDTIGYSGVAYYLPILSFLSMGWKWAIVSACVSILNVAQICGHESMMGMEPAKPSGIDTYLIGYIHNTFLLIAVFIFSRQTEKREIQNLLYRETNAKLRTKAKMAEAENRAKTSFLAVMTHELKTPLAAITAAAEILDGHLHMSENEKAKWHGVLATGTQNLRSLIDDVLILARIESGQRHLGNPVNFKLPVIVTKVLSLMSVSAVEKGLEVKSQIPSEDSMQYVGDPAAVGQIVTNLVGNAIKYCDQGVIEVDVKVVWKFNSIEEVDHYKSWFSQSISINNSRSPSSSKIFKEDDFKWDEISVVSEVSAASPVGITTVRRRRTSDYVRTTSYEKEISEKLDKYLEMDQTRSEIVANIVRISVFDSGPGIPAHMQDKIFTKFNGSHGTADGIRTGTGLGLSIVKELVQMMHGRVWVESPGQLGKGSTFYVDILLENASEYVVSSIASESIDNESRNSFPIQTALDLPAVEKARRLSYDESNENMEPSDESAKGRVLIAEDNRHLQMAFQYHLASAGHEVVLAGNGEIAVDNYVASLNGKIKPFDVILMDVQMPVMNGLEAVREIRRQEEKRQNGDHIPIVFLTAHTLVSEIEQCFDAGGSGYLSKPISRDRLVSAVESLGESALQLIDLKKLKEEACNK